MKANEDALVKVFHGVKTLEYDLALHEANRSAMLKALKEVDRLARIPSASPEQGVIRTYVDWLVSLPWGVVTDDNLDLDEAEKVLNEDHWGLEKPKERIVEYMAVRKLAGDHMAGSGG